MNSTLVSIMDTRCPKCNEKVRRDVHVPLFGCGKNFIVWTCTNDQCIKSNTWFKGDRAIKSVVEEYK